MRRAKIVCTLGPASTSQEMMEKLLAAGMDVARLNFTRVDVDAPGPGCLRRPAFQPSAHRTNLKNLLPVPEIVPWWNVEKG